MKEQAATLPGFDPADPTSHPDFVGCDHPLTKWEPPTVYVPSLVYLLHRLGGPENIADGRYSESAIYTTHGTVIAEVSRTANGDGSFSLCVDQWHYNKTCDCLTVIFNVPAQWHLGEWEVETVMCMDEFCNSAELAREVALLCNRMVGCALADD